MEIVADAVLNALAGKGKKVKVDLLRDGKEKSIEVTLGEQPADGTTAGLGGEGTEDTGLFAGVSVQELDPAARGRLRIPG